MPYKTKQRKIDPKQQQYAARYRAALERGDINPPTFRLETIDTKINYQKSAGSRYETTNNH